MTTKRLYYILLGLLLTLLLIEGNMFFNHHAKQFMDGDQTLFWLYAQDLSEGEFHSPYLYGQNYNIPLESLLAVPLLWMGMQANEALPLVCMLLTLIPFLLVSRWFYLQQMFWSSLITLLVLLMLPIEWSMISAAPRGFIGGISLAAIGYYTIATRDQIGYKTIGYFLILVAMLINPNAAVLALPFGLYHLFHQRFNARAALIAILSATIPFIYLQWFKSAHSDQFIHMSWTLQWSWVDLYINLLHFNDLFKGIFPIFYEIGSLFPLSILLLLAYAFSRADSQMKWLVGIFVLFLLFSLGINKVKDGTNSVFFPYSRMFLAGPLVISLFLSEIERLKKVRLHRLWIILIPVLSLASFWIKDATANARTERALKTNSGVVQLTDLKGLQQSMDQFEALLKTHDKDLLIFHSKADAYNYGARILKDIRTLHPAYERCQWLLHKEAATSLDRVLVIDWSERYDSLHPNLPVKRLDEPRWPVYYFPKGSGQVSALLE